MDSSVLPSISYKEKVYGITFAGPKMYVYLYNKQIFLELGLEPPTTYEEFKTVCQTLKDAGVIKEVLTEPGRVRYDANISHHHHFVDVKTGKIVDIPADKVEAIGELLGDQYKVHGFQVLFYGELEQH